MLVLLLTLLGGALLLLLFLVLCCPILYRAHYRWDEALLYQVTFGSPLFRFTVVGEGREKRLGYRVFGLPFHPRNKKKKGEKKRRGKEPKQKEKKKPSGFSLSLMTRENIEHITTFLVGLLRLLKPEIFQIHLRVGLFDPGTNGMIQAFFHTIQITHPSFPVHWEAVWEEEVLESSGRVKGRFIPAGLLFKILFFLFSGKTWRLFLQVRRQRRARMKGDK